MRVAVVGLGRLGAVLAAVLSDSGVDVVGVDVNQVTVDAVNAGCSPVDEPGLDLLLLSTELTASTSFGVVVDCDVVMVVVPTPSDDSGWFDSSYVEAAVRSIGEVFAKEEHQEWHTVVVCSTIMPGTMEGTIRGALEESSGREVGRTIGLAYNPLFIALGTVIENLRSPDMVLIGVSDPMSAYEVSMVSRKYQSAPRGFVKHEVMGFVDAELTKLATNVYLSLKIGFANSVCQLALDLGADPVEVLNAVGDDSRIGRKFLRPGPPPAGPCLPRDVMAMEALANTLHREVPLTRAATQESELVVDRIIDEILSHAPEKVAILGFAYKPGSSVMDASLGVRLMDKLKYLPRPLETVYSHDPSGLTNIGLEWGYTAQETVDHSQVVVIACPHDEYLELDYGDKVVIRPWR